MNVLPAAIAILFGGVTCGFAEPMWKSSDKWRCNMEAHIKAPIGGDPLVLDHTGKFFDLNFSGGTLTSVFSDRIGLIAEKHYYVGVADDYNVIVSSWDGSEYPIIIIENGGEYWQTTASGHTEKGREVWIATYRCLPKP